MRHVRAEGQPAAGLPPGPQPHRRVDLDHVGPPVVGVGPRRHVPRASTNSRVHRPPRAPPPPATGRRDDDVGDGDVPTVVGLDPEHVEREAQPRGAGAPAPPASAAGRRRSAGTSTGRTPDVDVGARPSESSTTRSAGASTSSPHVSPGRIVIDARAVGAARRGGTSTTVGDDTRNARSATSRAGGGSTARGAIERHLTGQVDQLLHRAHEVAAGQQLLGDDVGEVLAEHPGVGGGDEAGVGRSVLGRARASARRRRGRSWWRRADASGPARRSTGTTAVGAAPGCGARTRTPTAARPARGVEPVEQAVRRHSATRRSPRGRPGPAPRRRVQRPRRSTYPRRSSTSSTRSNSAANGLVVPVDPTGQLDELPLQALGLAGGPHPLAQVGIGLDGV